MSWLIHFVSVDAGQQGVLPPKCESNEWSPITYILGHDSPRLDRLNEYQPYKTAVDVNVIAMVVHNPGTIVPTILGQPARSSVVEARCGYDLSAGLCPGDCGPVISLSSFRSQR